VVSPVIANTGTRPGISKQPQSLRATCVFQLSGEIQSDVVWKAHSFFVQPDSDNVATSEYSGQNNWQCDFEPVAGRHGPELSSNVIRSSSRLGSDQSVGSGRF